MRTLRTLRIALAAICLIAFTGFGQQQKRLPRILVVAKRAISPPIGFAPLNFGRTCRATSDAQSPYYHSYKELSVLEMMGASVATIKITGYSNEWKNRDDLARRVASILEATTMGGDPGPEWDEGVFSDVVGTIEYADKTQGAFEESGGHVCFVDHSGSALWTRVQVNR